MMQRFARSGLWLLLLVGWAGQQLLPWLHEAQMRGGYAGVFCGASSIGERRRFAATAPPELRAAIARRDSSSGVDAGAAACVLCAAVHAPLAAAGAVPGWTRAIDRFVPLLRPRPALLHGPLLSQPRARGPPRKASQKTPSGGIA